MSVNISSQHYEVVPESKFTEQAPDKPKDQKAIIALKTINALTNEQLNLVEKEVDDVQITRFKARLATVSVSPIESYTTRETVTQQSIEELQVESLPSMALASPEIINFEELLISEALPNDTKPENFESPVKQYEKAEVNLTLQEAKTINEMIVNQSETVLNEYSKPQTVTADDTVYPHVGVSVYEIQEGLFEDKLETEKFNIAKPKVNVVPTEPVFIEEVMSEVQPSKYYPELIVPTEQALTVIVPQQQCITEETHAPEKEGIHMADKVPLSQNASINISTTRDVAIVREHHLQEKENVLQIDRKIDSFEAQQHINLLEGIFVSTVNHQDKESIFDVDETFEFNADTSFSENMSVSITETIVTEKEDEYQLYKKPSLRIADSEIMALNVSSTLSTVVEDSVMEYIPEMKSTSALAETTVRPIEYVHTSEVQTADYPSDFKSDLKYIEETSTFSVETTEAKIIHETLTNDKEKMFTEEQMEQFNVAISFNPIKSIEISLHIPIEKESDLSINELPDSHKSKSVPTHPKLSVQVEEITGHDSTGEVEKLTPLSAKAKVDNERMEGTIVDQVLPIEQVVSSTAEQLNPRNADVIIDELESIRTKEIIVNESETEYTKYAHTRAAQATTDIATNIAIVQNEIRTESPTNESIPDFISKEVEAESHQTPMESIFINIQEIVEKEDVYYNEEHPSEKSINVNLSDTRSGVSILEVIMNDSEQPLVSQLQRPADTKAETLIETYMTAVKTEILSNHDAPEIIPDKPTSKKAISNQEALDEMVVTEIHIAESEKPYTVDTVPLTHSAEVDIINMEKLSVNEIVTSLIKVSKSCITIMVEIIIQSCE